MSYFACHIEKFKSNDVRGLQIHNQRESSKSKNKDIDQNKTSLNYDLHNDGNINYNQRIKEIIAEGYKGAKAIRKDATVMTSTIITSDKGFFDKLPLEDQKKFFEEAYKFLKDCYGEKNIVSAVVHMDEKTPHMHVTAVPLTDDGRLSAKKIIDRKFLRHIQKAIPELLQSKGFDIERGIEGSAKGHTDTNDYKREQERKLREENKELKSQNEELRKGYPSDNLRNWEINNKLRKENADLKSKVNLANKVIGSLSKEFQNEFLNKKNEIKINEKTNAPKIKSRDMDLTQ